MKRSLVLALVLGLTACSGSIPGGSTVPSTADSLRMPLDVLGSAPSVRPLNIALFDAPLVHGQGVKVNIALDGIQLLAGGGSAIPFTSNQSAQVINLIDLQDHSLDFKGQAPAGTYSGVRFVINTAGSNVTIGNYTIPIMWGTPGHVVTGSIVAVDFKVPFAIPPIGNGNPLGKGPTSLALDFNVMQSVRFANGAIYVQPSVSGAAAAAQISGKVANKAGKPVSGAAVLATDVLGNVVNVTATRADGSYVIHALPAGFYTVAVRNSYVTKSGETFTASGNDANYAPSQGIVLSPNDDLVLPTLLD